MAAVRNYSVSAVGLIISIFHILSYRSQILAKLEQHSATISEKSRIMQRKLLAV